MVLTLDLSPKIWKEINSIDIIKELMITKLKKKRMASKRGFDAALCVVIRHGGFWVNSNVRESQRKFSPAHRVRGPVHTTPKEFE